MAQCASLARCYGGPADDALGPQTAAWPASTSAAFMMPPMPKAGAIRIPNATTVAGATRQTSRILSATVATGALYMFRASKCTGAHTPCMATGETIWAHA